MAREPEGAPPGAEARTTAEAGRATEANAAARVAAVAPPAVREILDRLHDAGHDGWAVGGSVRDALLGRRPADWDLATDARPDRLLELFPGAVYENRFGTVAVRTHGSGVVEITTFRSEHDYADFRRPHRVEFGDTVDIDLARRDFTVNAIAWGRAGTDGQATDEQPNRIEDPFGGLADLAARRLRAVGNPDARFREDALRMVRAVRLAATLEMDVEERTLAAIGANAGLVAHLSGERIGAELEKLLAAPAPSRGLALAHDTGLLAVFAPELAAQRGIPQSKAEGEDLWDHTLRTVDAAPQGRPIVRLAALLHDIGKPPTFADGHFHHHEAAGATLADALLRRLRYPRTPAEEVVHLVRHHMFIADPSLSDGAIRRFIGRIGREHLDALFALRRADDVGSHADPDDETGTAFRRRVEAELAAEAALDRYALVISGHDLMRELGLTPGRRLGQVIDALTERVVDDPALNERATLILLAQGILADMDEAPADR